MFKKQENKPRKARHFPKQYFNLNWLPVMRVTDEGICLATKINCWQINQPLAPPFKAQIKLCK